MLRELEAILAGTSQEHVLQHWASLSPTEQAHLHAQCKTVLRDAATVRFYNDVFATSMKALADGVSGRVEPPRPEDLTAWGGSSNAALRAKYEATGLAAIARGACGVVVLAGGSGTRLGATFPKGMLTCPAGRLNKSLFEWHCDRVRGVERMAAAHVPGSAPCVQVAFMTSAQTHAQTEAFFLEHKYFGLEGRCSFFQQSAFPCYTAEGKIILEDKGTLATAPGGNGGIWSAFAESGVLKRFAAAGVTHVQILTVDNILAMVADPRFYGFALESAADVAVKATPKVHDHEPVGVFALRDGRCGVVEYTEIGKSRAEERNPATGSRLFDCANVAIHLCTTAFMGQAAEVMKTFQYYHAARKPIPSRLAEAGTVAGVKLEAFIFDVFQFAGTTKIAMVDRAEEFAPIKNADSGPHIKDSPSTAMAMLHALHGRWLVAAAGGAPPAEPVLAEVSPLASYGGEAASFAPAVVKAFVAFCNGPHAHDGSVFLVADDGSVRIAAPVAPHA